MTTSQTDHVDTSAVTTDAALSIKDLKKRFGKVQALDGVSFDVPPQCIFGLLGPNGAGKTTLFSVTADFIRADGGSVKILGCDSRRISDVLGRLSILPQDALFQRNVPILEQLVFFRRLEGSTRQEAEKEVKKTLELVGLGEYAHRRVYSLSHGMIKRLGIAQAFLGNPEVILLDEATSGLDPQNARQIRDLVRELRSRATIVFSSHNLAEVQELCDRVAILDKGRLVFNGSVSDIARASRRAEFRLNRDLADTEGQEIANVPGVQRLEARGERRYLLHLGADLTDEDVDRTVSAVLRRFLDLGITPRAMSEGYSLEEHFLKVISEN